MSASAGIVSTTGALRVGKRANGRGIKEIQTFRSALILTTFIFCSRCDQQAADRWRTRCAECPARSPRLEGWKNAKGSAYEKKSDPASDCRGRERGGGARHRRGCRLRGERGERQGGAGQVRARP